MALSANFVAQLVTQFVSQFVEVANVVAYAHWDTAGDIIRHQQYKLSVAVSLSSTANILSPTLPVLIPQCDIPLTVVLPVCPDQFIVFIDGVIFVVVASGSSTPHNFNSLV